MYLELRERCALMFKVDATEPVASGRKAVAPVVTKELVQFAWLAVTELCDEHGPAFSQAYGNFDRVVGMGWLLGDVHLGCKIDHTYAFKVGRRAAKLAPGYKAEFDAPERRLCKRKHVSEEDRDAAAKEEVELRMAPIKLEFPIAPALETAASAPAPSPATVVVTRPGWPPLSASADGQAGSVKLPLLIASHSLWAAAAVGACTCPKIFRTIVASPKHSWGRRRRNVQLLRTGSQRRTLR